MNRVRALIDQYGLEVHPEGGYYVRTYCSQTMLEVPGFPGPRPSSTAIYFLLEAGNFSAFHRIQSDECWHFYEGGCLHVHILYPDGEWKTVRLGSDISKGEVYQFVVPANCWFASEPAPGTGYSLVGCTVSPGFDFADFELANATILSNEYPAHATFIQRLCR